MTSKLPQFPPSQFLACPVCGAAASSAGQSGLKLSKLICSACKTHFFTIDKIPCLFPSGLDHKTLWQHQFGTVQAQGALGLDLLQESASRYDLTANSRQRIHDLYHALQHGQRSAAELMSTAGIQPVIDKRLQDSEAGDFAAYYDLILRDWGWDQQPNKYFTRSENSAATERALAVLPEAKEPPASLLVLGAGAGRLSWDLHQQLNSQCTIAFDCNPLPLLVANSLIRQQKPLTFSEIKTFPQINHPITHYWDLTPPEDAKGQRENWFPLAGNVWCAPFNAASFEIIVTPWFIDVNGGDLRDLIGVIQKLLKPGGLWINSGPLLFTPHLPFHQKYQNTEILEFLDLCGFTLLNQRLDNVAYLASPLEERARIEQVWSFCARAPQQTNHEQNTTPLTPPWLIMHHLPIPPLPLRASQDHPLIKALLQLINGKNSINTISANLAHAIPEGILPRDAVVTLLGQMLRNLYETTSP